VLLQEVHDLLEDIRSKKQEKKTTIEKKKAETEIGKEARDCVAFNFIESENIANFMSQHECDPGISIVVIVTNENQGKLFFIIYVLITKQITV
jgi:hypothetical protein